MHNKWFIYRCFGGVVDSALALHNGSPYTTGWIHTKLSGP